MTAPRCKVLHITEGYAGGVATFLRHVLPAQINCGLEVSLICSPRNAREDSRDIEELRRQGVNVYVVRMARSANPIRDITAFKSILRIMSDGQYNIVHTHCFKAGLLGRLAARRFQNIATMHTPHCFPFLRCPNPLVAGITRLTEQYMSRMTDALMLVSTSQARLAQQANIVSRHGTIVVPNGITADRTSRDKFAPALRRELDIPDDHLIVGTCCRLVAYKGIEQLIRCACALSRDNPKLTFVVVGDGPRRKAIESLIHRLGLERAIRMVGWRADGPALVGLMDILVLCSQAEGMPYVLLEAMTQGTTIVASNVPGNNDLITDSRDGLLYQYGNLDSVVQAVRRCVEDRSLREELAATAFYKVITMHRLDNQVEAMVNAYRAICPSDGSVSVCSPPKPFIQAGEAATWN